MVTRDVITHVMLGLRLAFVIIVSALIAACGSHPSGGPPASQIIGVVAAGPVAPGARPGAPATRAVQGVTVEALRGSQIIAAARTDEAGRYELTLPPGTYLIRAQSDKYLSKEERKTVTLGRGQKLTVDLVFDTGIS